MAIDCDPNALMDAAKCFNSCIPPGMHAPIQTYLLAVKAGGSLDPNQLIQDAACFNSCIAPGMHLPVQIKLLCDILNQ